MEMNTKMTEKIIKQYFCDYCGNEIDQDSNDSIRSFPYGNGSDKGIVIRKLKNTDNDRKGVAVKFEGGDFCCMAHMSLYLTKQLDEETARKDRINGY